MQQFSMPLFIEEEALIFGPLTLLQFMILGAAGGIVLLVLSLTNNLVLTFVLGLIAGIPATYLAFGKVNGEKVPKILILAIKFKTGDKMSLWQKKGEEGLSLKEIQRVFEERRKLIPMAKESKLKKLAWDVETGKK
jgi:hypothetical protein